MAIQVEVRKQFISPKKQLLTQAANIERHIEGTGWFRPICFSYDLPDGEEALHPFQREFTDAFSYSAQNQGHLLLKNPRPESDLIFGFHTIPFGSEPLTQRVAEIEPLVLEASRRYGFNALQKRYIAVVPLEDDVTRMPKRQMETTMRMFMERLGAFSILAINPRSGYYALGTLEGGLGVEYTNRVGVIDRTRDRLVTYACAKDAGSYQGIKDAISEEDWSATNMPQYIADAFRDFAGRGYVPSPFEYSSVASPERTRLIQKVLGHSRQAESASAAEDPKARVPLIYRMGKATGAIISTVTGRTGADKRNMDPKKHFVTVSIVPNEDYQPGVDDPLSLYGFRRYALLRPGYENLVPSVEFDEMAAAIFKSPLIRVSEHPAGHGYRKDPNGKIFMHRVRGFKHVHQGVEEITSRTMWGRDTLNMIEYVPANLREYPYQVGCGKDIMFACSTDATARSIGAQNPDSGIAVALFDAINHGTNVLLLAEPIPGTDYIPEDPYEIYMRFVNKYPDDLLDYEREVIQFTDELAQI